MKYFLLTLLVLKIYDQVDCLENTDDIKSLNNENNVDSGYIDTILKTFVRNSFAPFNVGTDTRSGPERYVSDGGNTRNSKIKCDSQNGRTVCRLDDYTFLINNGEQPLDADTLERLAAMLYHKSRRGDSSFEIGVNSDRKEVFSVASNDNELEKVSPIVVECNPLKNEKALSPSVTYECNWKETKSQPRTPLKTDERPLDDFSFPNREMVKRIMSLIPERRLLDRLRDFPPLLSHNNNFGNIFSNEDTSRFTANCKNPKQRHQKRDAKYFRKKVQNQQEELEKNRSPPRVNLNDEAAKGHKNEDVSGKMDSVRHNADERISEKLADTKVLKRQCCPKECTKPPCCPMPLFKASLPCPEPTPCCPPKPPPPCCPLNGPTAVTS